MFVIIGRERGSFRDNKDFWSVLGLGLDAVNPDVVVANDGDEDDAADELPACPECIRAGNDADKSSCGIVDSVGDPIEDKNGWAEAGGDGFGTGTINLGIGSNFKFVSGKRCPVPLRRRVAPTGGRIVSMMKVGE